MVNECTREDIKRNTKTCIDHLFLKTNITKTTQAQASIVMTTISDHYSLFCCINKEENSQVKENLLRQGPKFNNFKINKKIQETNWRAIMNQTSNTNNLYNKIQETFNEIYKNSVINNKTSVKRSINPWINDEIVKYCDIRDKLFKKWRNNHKNKRYEEEYKKFRNFVNKKIIYEKNNYLKKKIY